MSVCVFEIWGGGDLEGTCCLKACMAASTWAGVRERQSTRERDTTGSCAASAGQSHWSDTPTTLRPHHRPRPHHHRCHATLKLGHRVEWIVDTIRAADSSRPRANPLRIPRVILDLSSVIMMKKILDKSVRNSYEGIAQAHSLHLCFLLNVNTFPVAQRATE